MQCVPTRSVGTRKGWIRVPPHTQERRNNLATNDRDNQIPRNRFLNESEMTDKKPYRT